MPENMHADITISIPSYNEKLFGCMKTAGNMLINPYYACLQLNFHLNGKFSEIPAKSECHGIIRLTGDR